MNGKLTWEQVAAHLSTWTTRDVIAKKTGGSPSCISKHLSNYKHLIETRRANGCGTRFYRLAA